MTTQGIKHINALKLLHTTNHTKVDRVCHINENHYNNFVKKLDYVVGEPIYDLDAGLYEVSIDNKDYVIDIYFSLIDNGDYLVIKDKFNIALYRSFNHYPIIAYLKESIIENSLQTITITDTVNSNIDAVLLSSITDISVSTGTLENPVSINRINSISITTGFDDNKNEFKIPLKRSLGCLPNGVMDYFIINNEQQIAHEIINTRREILSDGMNWQYQKDYSNDNYYVFFVNKTNVKNNNDNKSLRCTHFETVNYSDIINPNIKKNCIAVSDDSIDNGIWIKIKSSLLDIKDNENINIELSNFINSKLKSENPICIEYQLTDTLYNTILIDDYSIKTWFNTTEFNMNSNCDYSLFYKSLNAQEV
jgi:hypothetical protein